MTEDAPGAQIVVGERVHQSLPSLVTTISRSHFQIEYRSGSQYEEAAPDKSDLRLEETLTSLEQ